MNFEFVIAEVEGFPTRNGGLILRELTLIFPNGQEQHFHFKNPETMCLNEVEMAAAKFCQRHQNGFSPTDNESCCLPAAVYPKVLEEIKHCRIYCAGESKRNFFARHLPDAHIVDVCTILDFCYPANLAGYPNCTFKLHRNRFCTLSKGRYLADQLEGYIL